MKTKILLSTSFLFSLLFGLNGIATAQTDFVWAKQMGGNQYDQAVAIAVDASGNVYTTGYFSGTADFDPGTGVFNLTPTGGMWDADIYISKLDASGNFIWAKQLGGVNYDQAIGIAVDASGNVYTAGTFSSTVDFDPGAGVFELTPYGGSWDQDIFICKLNSDGNFVWAKQLGSTNYDQITGMALDASGNVYTTGGFSETEDFDPGAGVYNLTPTGGMWDQDIFVSKLDPSGNFVWAKQFGGINYDQSGGIAIDASGNVLTTGGFYGPSDFNPGTGVDTLSSVTDSYGYPSEDIFICKLNSDGEYVWAKSMGGEGYEQGSAITAFANGDVYSTGTFSQAVDFDPGPGSWTLTPSGTYNNDVYVSKLHSMGLFEWVMELGGPGYEYVSSISVDAASNVFTAGAFEGVADFNPGSEVNNLIAEGGDYTQDAFISKLDAAGYYVWAKGFGGINYDQASDIYVDVTGNVYTTGSFGDTVDFDPGPGVIDFYSFGGEYDNDDFVLKLHNSNVGITEHNAATTSEFSVYPVPNNGQFNISMNLKSDEKLTVEIVDITGKLLKSFNESKINAGINSMPIDASELSNGIYFVRVYNATINNTMKIIINK